LTFADKTNMALEPAEILAQIQKHRLDARRMVSALKQLVIVAHENGFRELADKADALADAITEAVNAHPCDA
jgi:hypothetical protein